MERKITFSDQPRRVKIIYAAVVGVLCVTAIVLGIVSAASKNNDTPLDDQTSGLPSADNNTDGEDQTDDENKEEDKKPQKLSFISPVSGEVVKHHSLDTPVFSDTLNEWRVHTGIDISAEEGAEVVCSATGVVSRVYSDPFLGKTVEVTHDGGIVSVYSNLAANGIKVKEGDALKPGTIIGTVGDTSLSELADESHLHFAIKVGGVSVNPMDYIGAEFGEIEQT